jgi:hypothetical protein
VLRTMDRRSHHRSEVTSALRFVSLRRSAASRLHTITVVGAPTVHPCTSVDTR